MPAGFPLLGDVPCLHVTWGCRGGHRDDTSLPSPWGVGPAALPMPLSRGAAGKDLGAGSWMRGQGLRLGPAVAHMPSAGDTLCPCSRRAEAPGNWLQQEEETTLAGAWLPVCAAPGLPENRDARSSFLNKPVQIEKYIYFCCSSRCQLGLEIPGQEKRSCSPRQK